MQHEQIEEAMSQAILREEFLVYGTNSTEQEKKRVTQRNACQHEFVKALLWIQDDREN